MVLSAGASSRMGQDKALLPWPPAADGTSSVGTTLLSAAIRALKPFAEAVIVVAGNNADSIAPVVAANGASIVQNPVPERGQFSSLQIGLREVLSRGCNAAMISAPVTSNAREVKRAHAEMIESVPVSDSLLSVDVNTPEEYAALMRGGPKSS